jgi:hypothetical protein
MEHEDNQPEEYGEEEMEEDENGEQEMFEHEFGENEMEENQFGDGSSKGDKTDMEGGEKESELEEGEVAPSVEGMSINDKLQMEIQNQIELK